METLVTSPVSTKFQASLYKVNDVRSKLKGGGWGLDLSEILTSQKKKHPNFQNHENPSGGRIIYIHL